MKTEEENAGLRKNISWYQFTSSKVVLLKTVLLHTVSTKSRKKRARVLSQPSFSLLEPLRKCTDTGFQLTLKEEMF